MIFKIPTNTTKKVASRFSNCERGRGIMRYWVIRVTLPPPIQARARQTPPDIPASLLLLLLNSSSSHHIIKSQNLRLPPTFSNWEDKVGHQISPYFLKESGKSCLKCHIFRGFRESIFSFLHSYSAVEEQMLAKNMF